MHLIEDVMTVPRSSCSVVKHARAILIVHVAVILAFVVGAYLAFASMDEEDAGAACAEPGVPLALSAKVGLAFLWGVIMVAPIPADPG